MRQSQYLENEGEVLTLFKNNNKGNIFSNENTLLQSLNKIFDQYLRLVKENVLNNYTNKRTLAILM